MVTRRGIGRTVVRAALVALAGVAHAHAAVAIQYEGIARDEDGAFAYREVHHLERADDGSGQRIVMYQCEDGRAFARKLVRYQAGSLAPDFALEDARTGYREGVRTTAGGRVVFVKKGEKKPERTAPLPGAKELVADAGFDDFIDRHWDTLSAGETARVAFLVPGELDALAFKLQRTGTTKVDGVESVVFRLALGAWYGGFLPHIDVTYHVEDRYLRRYEGLSNVRDLDLDNLVVRIDFPRAARVPLDAAARDAAREAPLARRCD